MADRVDSALRCFWDGDTEAVSRLPGAGGPDGPDVGKVLAELHHAAEATLTLPIRPDLVPGYRIVRELGRGGMGIVYEAFQEGTNRTVALKIMLPGYFSSPQAVARFRREVELSARLEHPGIVRVFESRQLADGTLYYSMEYVPGMTLDRYLAAARLSTRGIVRLFVMLCGALAYAHRKGIVHRDLKPGNVIVDDQGMPHIVDFGLAKARDAASADALAVTIAEPGQVVGTVRYLSPEQAAGHLDQVREQSDVYSLGVMLYEALTGQMPYDMGGGPAAVLQRIIAATPRRPSAITNSVDRELEIIVLKALEKEAARRYASGEEFGADLQRWLDGEPIAARAAGLLYRLKKRLKRHRRLALAGTGLVLFAGVALGFALVAQLRLRTVTANELMKQANIRLRCGAYQEALDYCEQARRHAVPGSDTNPQADLLCGHIHLCLGDYGRALNYYDGANRYFLLVNYPWCAYHRATVLWILGRHAEAADDYRTVLTLRPQHLYTVARLYLLCEEHARILEQRGYVALAGQVRAQALAELAEARAKAEPGSWFEEILACVGQERPPEVLLERAASDSMVHRCEAYYYAAEAYLLRGDLAQARYWFRECVRTDMVIDMQAVGTTPMSEYHLARWRLNQLSESAQAPATVPGNAP